MRINKDQIKFSKWETLKFSYKRARGQILPYITNRIRWYYYPTFHIVSKYPSHVDIDVSTVCNMRCPMCITLTSHFKDNVNPGYMSEKLFKKVIDECGRNGVFSIRICARGEPFLHKNIIKFIKYAHDSGIKEISMISNILSLPPSLFKEAMEAGLSWLTISFDGLGKTYEQIRRPAKFDEAYNKIKEYKRIKEEAGSYRPIIKVQSIWPALKDCLEEYYEKFSPYVDNIASNPLMDKLEKDTNIDFYENFDCHVLYQRLSIGIDGNVKLCIHDDSTTIQIGSLSTQSIHEIWHGEKLNKMRELHKRHKAVKHLRPCFYCHYPRKTIPVLKSFKGNALEVEEYTRRSQTIGK